MQQYRCTQCGGWHVGSYMHLPRPLRLITSGLRDWRYA